MPVILGRAGTNIQRVGTNIQRVGTNMQNFIIQLNFVGGSAEAVGCPWAAQMPSQIVPQMV